MVQIGTKPDRETVRRASGPNMVQNVQESLRTQNGTKPVRRASGPRMVQNHPKSNQESLGTQKAPDWHKTIQETSQESLGTQNGIQPDRKVARKAQEAHQKKREASGHNKCNKKHWKHV